MSATIEEVANNAGPDVVVSNRHGDRSTRPGIERAGLNGERRGLWQRLNTDPGSLRRTEKGNIPKDMVTAEQAIAPPPIVPMRYAWGASSFSDEVRVKPRLAGFTEDLMTNSSSVEASTLVHRKLGRFIWWLELRKG
jgi:hypothetical protein